MMKRLLKKRIEDYFDKLWPIHRCLAGPGFRKSMDIIGEIMPVERLRFETGRKVLDWTVPKEWKVNEAYFIDPEGVRHGDVNKNNLHLVSYSIPFQGSMPLSELRQHLHTLPEQPDAIPYITSFYQD